MSALSSQEFEECGACFYLSGHVYERFLIEPTPAFLLLEQKVFKMQTGYLGCPLLHSHLLVVRSAVFPNFTS